MKTMIGYKATDKDMKCRGVQFVLGEWSEPVQGDLIECKNGYHFCEHPSGVWNYYSGPGTRVFKVECEDVLDTPQSPGANSKRVCRRVRLISEVAIDGYRNTGDYNTGHRNTGDRNTGDCNTGDYNTGDYNTGYCNTGDYNTGHRNTGYYNTGDYNTGDYNTGYRNTGDCNATSRSVGVFCVEQQTIPCFDVDTGLTWDEFMSKYNHQYSALRNSLRSDAVITDFSKFESLPGFTPEKLSLLHAKMIAARNKKENQS